MLLIWVVVEGGSRKASGGVGNLWELWKIEARSTRQVPATRRSSSTNHQALSGQAQAVGCLGIAGNGLRRRGAQAGKGPATISVDVRSDSPASPAGRVDDGGYVLVRAGVGLDVKFCEVARACPI